MYIHQGAWVAVPLALGVIIGNLAAEKRGTAAPPTRLVLALVAATFGLVVAVIALLLPDTCRTAQCDEGLSEWFFLSPLILVAGLASLGALIGSSRIVTVLKATVAVIAAQIALLALAFLVLPRD
jgi:hypothetical protein